MQGKRSSSVQAGIVLSVFCVAPLMASSRTDRCLWHTACARTLGYIANSISIPRTLILSAGIGNPEILRKAGIESHIDLPAVGENLQVSRLESSTVVAYGCEHATGRIMQASTRTSRSRAHCLRWVSSSRTDSMTAITWLIRCAMFQTG